VHDDSYPLLDAPAVIVDRWARNFRLYRERIERSGLDLRMELPARLARVGVYPVILRQDIDNRRAVGWSIDDIGLVLNALVMETHRSDHVSDAKVQAAFARALFDLMIERYPCPLAELAASVIYPRKVA
jgi:hypothetical protein